MSQFGSGGVKNPPWARQGQQTQSMLGQNTNNSMQQQGGQMQQAPMAGQASLLQYPPQQIFQQNQMQQAMSMGHGVMGASAAAAMPANAVQMQPHIQQTQPNMFNQMGAISYPTRQQLNTAAFSPAATLAASRQQLIAAPNTQQPPPNHHQHQQQQQQHQQQQQPMVNSNNNNAAMNTPQKQRVFTGVVTKIMPDFGFVDDDVFFLLSAVKGPEVTVGDRVLVTAVFNAYMQHKWNALCIELLDRTRPQPFSNYNAVPPPIDNCSNSGNNDMGRRQRRREEARSRRDDDVLVDRKKRREDRRERDDKEKDKERARSPSTSVRKRSKSPRRRKVRAIPRYMVYIPQITLDVREANVMELKKRYTSMYVPSDFFTSLIPRVDVFPAHRSLSLDKPCAFHIMHKDVAPPPLLAAAPQDPHDADYLFSAKVMLLGMPPLADIYKRACLLAEDAEADGGSITGSSECVHVTRLIQLLVGVRGKNENMAIGGPWSPSLDGADPATDPSVLIKTAVRNCRALTGIDLSKCTQWFRFLEIYYRRAESTHKGKVVPARVETVVIFVPDVWSCTPTQLEWDSLQAAYKQALARKLHAGDDEPEPAADVDPADSDDEEQLVAEVEPMSVDAADADPSVDAAADPSEAADEKETEETDNEEKKKPTHHSQLDVKTMKVTSLRDELEARGLSSKGIKSLLTARLTKALKSEQETSEADEKSDSKSETPTPKSPSHKDTDKEEKKEEKDKKDKKKKEEDSVSLRKKKPIDEKERHLLEKRYTLPDSPCVVVHPSPTAKSGKFDCSLMSLSLLLDYREADTKEHFFEVSLFAELFNEMLMRDFAFRIYRALLEAPEKPKEEKDDKDKKDRDRKDKKDDKDRKDKDKEKDKREKDEKKDSKRNEEEEDDDDDEDEDVDSEIDLLKQMIKERKDKSKKKREKVKMVTEDPFLLLAFVYFDQSQCGYILDKDLESMLLTLNLNLSRSQIKKLVQKVVTGTSLHYRTLTDKPKVEDKDKEGEKDGDSKLNGDQKKIDIESAAAGNKSLLPIFRFETDSGSLSKTTSSDDTTDKPSSHGRILYKGAFIDIEQLLNQLSRSETARTETEKHLAKLRSDYASLKEYSTKCEVNLKDIKAELKGVKEKLSNNETGYSKIEAKANQYLETLADINKKILPFIQKDVKEETAEKSPKASTESVKIKTEKVET